MKENNIKPVDVLVVILLIPVYFAMRLFDLYKYIKECILQ
jgi:hypothetical protein